MYLQAKEGSEFLMQKQCKLTRHICTRVWLNLTGGAPLKRQGGTPKYTSGRSGFRRPVAVICVRTAAVESSRCSFVAFPFAFKPSTPWNYEGAAIPCISELRNDNGSARTRLLPWLGIASSHSWRHFFPSSSRIFVLLYFCTHCHGYAVFYESLHSPCLRKIFQFLEIYLVTAKPWLGNNPLPFPNSQYSLGVASLAGRGERGGGARK